MKDGGCAVEASSARRYSVGAALVVCAVALWTVGMARHGYLYADDFLYQSIASKAPFTWSTFFADTFDHFFPGLWAWFFVSSRLAPFNYNWHLFLIAVLLAATLFLIWRVVARIAGVRWLSLLFVAALGLSSLCVPTWYFVSSAVNLLPTQFAGALAALALLRGLQDGARDSALLGVVAVALGLSFWEKAGLIPVLLLGVTVVIPQAWDGQTWKQRLSATRFFWLAQGALLLLYVILRQQYVDSPPLVFPAIGQLTRFLGRAVFVNLAPLTIGGPFTWTPVLDGFPFSLMGPPLWAQVIGGLVLALVLGAVVLRRRQAIGAVLVFSLYFLLSAGIIAMSRLEIQGTQIALDSRYFADLLVPAAIIGAILLACLPQRRPRLEMALGVLLSLACLGSLVSAVAYAQQWKINPARTWVINAQASIAQLPPNVSFVDGRLPMSTFTYLFDAVGFERVSQFLGPVVDNQRFDTAGEAAATPDAQGRFLFGSFVAQPAGEPAQPVDQCGTSVKVSFRGPELGDAGPDKLWVTRLDLSAPAPTVAVMSLGRNSTFTRQVARGENMVVMTTRDYPTQLQLTAPGEVCVDSVVRGIFR